MLLLVPVSFSAEIAPVAPSQVQPWKVLLLAFASVTALCPALVAWNKQSVKVELSRPVMFASAPSALSNRTELNWQRIGLPKS